MKALIKRSDTLPLHVVQDHVVQRLQQAEEALAYAVGIDQVRLVMDVAAAQEVFATRQRMGEAVIGQAHTLKVRALVKLGELLEALPKAGPQHSKGGGSKGSTREPLLDAPATYAELGVTKKLASVAQQLAALPESTREAIAQREVTPYARSLVRGLPRISSSLLINVRGPAVEHLDDPTHRLAVRARPSAQQRR